MSAAETLRGELITLRSQQVREAQARIKSYYSAGPGIGYAPGMGSTIPGSQGWFPIFGAREPFTGAFQSNIIYDQTTILAFFAVYSCITLISQDIGKLRWKLVEEQAAKWWKEISSPAYSPLLRKPNQYQNRIKWLEFWITCKLIHGNAYGLKARDERGVVTAIYILNPCNTRPLVSPDGAVFYQTSYDNLSTVNVDLEDDDMPEGVFIIPAREIIHDPMTCLFHPLIGVSPIFACGAAAMKGAAIDDAGRRFFENGGQPGGILTAPGAISDSTADRLKRYWDDNFTGANAGKVAVVGDGLKYERLTMSAEDAQTIETMKLTAEQVCSAFHVPPYMIGIGPMPAYNNIEALNQQYYSQCLQSLIENFELCMDEGLSLVTPSQSYGIELDLKGLLRMDTATRYKAHSDAITGGWLKPDEARIEEDLPPVPGGNTPYMQQQQYSLGALAERDADKPFSKPTPALPPPPDEEDEDPEEVAREFMRELSTHIAKELAA